MEQHTSGRVIKFRAWDGKQIVEDAALLRSDGDAELAAFDDNSNVVWLQFTGLTDKNGKEIYEGAIVKLWHVDDEDELLDTFEVKWSKEGGYWAPDAYGFDYCPVLGHDELAAEVIGNIYENPTLLK